MPFRLPFVVPISLPGAKYFISYLPISFLILHPTGPPYPLFLSFCFSLRFQSVSSFSFNFVILLCFPLKREDFFETHLLFVFFVFGTMYYYSEFSWLSLWRFSRIVTSLLFLLFFLLNISLSCLHFSVSMFHAVHCSIVMPEFSQKFQP